MDLVVSFLSAVPLAVQAKFQQKTLFLQVPVAPVGQGRSFYADWLAKMNDGTGRVIPGMYKAAGGTGPIGRVAFIGFSNGVDSGVSQVLEAKDAQKIDFIGAFDGIHGRFAQKPLLSPVTYAKWIAFGRLSAKSRPSQSARTQQLVITHSSIEPTFPSTTETASLIWTEVMKTAPADYEALYWAELDRYYPNGVTIKNPDSTKSFTWSSFVDGWYDRRVCNGLAVFGWGDPGKSAGGRVPAVCRDTVNCKTDHIFQGKYVLPAILETYLVPRWNPACEQPVSGLGETPPTCGTGDGMGYDEGPDGPLEAPDLAPTPVAPAACPYPSAGVVVVGAKGDPCRTAVPTVPMPLPPTTPPANDTAPEGTGTGTKLLALAAGAAGGYLATRWLMGRRKLR